jgi:hypothetical protein
MRCGADTGRRTRGLDHGVVALCLLSYIRFDANAHRTQLCRRVRGNLLKSRPTRPCASVRSGGTRGPVADRLKNKEARILSESGPRRVIEWKGARLSASLARMHPILVAQRPGRSLALDRMPFIHRDDRRDLAKGGAHERTLTLDGQRAVCDVALALHDELFDDEVVFGLSTAALTAARRRTVKSLHFIVKRVRQSFFSRPVSSTRQPVPDNITVNRRQNVLILFQLFAEEQMRAGVPPKGMEQAFAQKLQMSPSMWSQIKSSRPIGDKLARQIEAACGQPQSWLDEAHEPQGHSASEQQFLALALKAWRSTNAEGRKRLKLAMKEVMATV